MQVPSGFLAGSFALGLYVLAGACAAGALCTVGLSRLRRSALSTG